VATGWYRAFNARGAGRIDVAKTIYYRRRKGTPRKVLEELISDITAGTAWSSRNFAGWRDLAQARPKAVFVCRSIHRTPPGGYAICAGHAARSWRAAFDEYFHSADVRMHAARWHYNIPKIALHMYV